MSNTPSRPELDLDQLGRPALIAGVVCLLVCVIGGIFSPTQFFRSYLVAYQFWLAIGLGSLTIVMLYHLTGGAWGYVTRAILEAGMRTLPLLALLFIPIFFGIGHLYIWSHPGVIREDEILWFKRWYLRPWFWIGRTVLFFLSWVALSYLLNRWSRAQATSGDPRIERRFRLLSGPGLVIYGIWITFAGVDWLMSLQPHYFSTIFSVIFGVGQVLTGLSFAIVVLTLLVDRPEMQEVVSPPVLNDLGNLLLTFVIFWTYVTFAQFMLTWIGNLPEEVIWYIPRSQGGWEFVITAIFLFHFAVPFLLLLSRDVKRTPRTLRLVAGMVCFMQLVHLHWQIQPAFSGTTLAEHWMDFLMPIGVGGLWLAYFTWQLRRWPLLPANDLNRPEAVHLHELALEEEFHEEAASHG
jgi:hypothetical protein